MGSWRGGIMRGGEGGEKGGEERGKGRGGE